MNLLQIRTQFIKLSGRYDLVVDSVDFLDNGADYFIESGIKFLDRQVGFDKEILRTTTAVTVGDTLITAANQRAIYEIYFYPTSGDDEIRLDHLSYTEAVETYGEFSLLDNDTPAHWIHAIDDDQLTADKIRILPPTDEAGNIEILMKRSTPWPGLDTGTNFWMDRHEDICVNAALMRLEASYRNTTGVNDWLSVIKLDLFGIEKDNIEDDVYQAEEMEG